MDRLTRDLNTEMDKDFPDLAKPLRHLARHSDGPLTRLALAVEQAQEAVTGVEELAILLTGLAPDWPNGARKADDNASGHFPRLEQMTEQLEVLTARIGSMAAHIRKVAGGV